MVGIRTIGCLSREGMPGNNSTGADTDAAPRDVIHDFVDAAHWFHSEVSISVDSKPEGLVSSDSVLADITG